MYSRFEAMDSYGKRELEELKGSTVAVIGLGATGSVIAEHLARHGVNLVLVDRDYLEPKDVYSSNIYLPEDCENAVPKAVAAENYLGKITEVESEITSLNPENIDILDKVDLLIDGTDNLETRFLLAEYSKKTGTPWIYTSALGTEGYSMFFQERCFNCIFDSVVPGSLETCETSGIMREVSGVAGSLTAEKAVKYLTGKDVEESLETVKGESFDVESGECEVCTGKSYPHLNSTRSTTAVCGENKYQVEISLSEKSFEKIRKIGKVVTENDYVLRAKVNGRNLALFRSGRIILEAEDKGHAESIVSETLGV